MGNSMFFIQLEANSQAHRSCLLRVSRVSDGSSGAGQSTERNSL